MRLFFDEDAGTGVAEALVSLGVLPPSDVKWVRRIWAKRKFPEPVQDETWIPWAAKYGFMVISRNVAISTTDSQRQLVADSELGIVFIPQHITTLEMFSLIQKRWTYLQNLFMNEPRPFVYHIPLTGPPRRDPCIPLDYNWRTRASLMQMLAESLRKICDQQRDEEEPPTTGPAKDRADGWVSFPGFLETVPLVESADGVAPAPMVAQAPRS